MKNWFFTLLFLSIGLFAAVGCTKMDPNAYKTDPILQDYQAQLGATNAELDALIKQIEGTRKDLNNATPQTGERTVHQKKLNDMLARQDRLNQQIQFWKIRIESRAKEAQAEYLVAFRDKKPWPDSQKVQAYQAEKRLRKAKMQWDQKDRIKNYKESSQPGSGGGYGSSAGGHEAPPGGH